MTRGMILMPSVVLLASTPAVAGPDEKSTAAIEPDGSVAQMSKKAATRAGTVAADGATFVTEKGG
jgi:hypothetical protein